MFVEEGNDVEEVERLTQGRGRIEKEQTAEMLFFPRDGGGMIDYQDGDSSLETDSLEGISSSSNRNPHSDRELFSNRRRLLVSTRLNRSLRSENGRLSSHLEAKDPSR